MTSFQDQIDGLNTAKSVALDQHNLFPEVLMKLAPLCHRADLSFGKWFATDFLYDSFCNPSSCLPRELQIANAPQVLGPLLHLVTKQDEFLFKSCVELATHVYPLAFEYLMNHAEGIAHWNTLNNLKEEIINKLSTSFPLPEFNKQTDLERSSSCKFAVVRFISCVIQVNLPAPARDPRAKRSKAEDNEDDDVSISKAPQDHPFIDKSLEAVGEGLLDMMFNLISDGILITTSIFTSLLNCMIILLKKRPKHVFNKLVNFILAYEPANQCDPIFEKDVLKQKLIRRFNDRFNKITIGFLLNRNFVKDPNLKARLQKKFAYLSAKGDEQKKRGILASDLEEPTQDVKRRKLETSSQEPVFFFNQNPVARDFRYTSLYSLIDPKDTLNSFDLSGIPQDILALMVVNAIQSTDFHKLKAGLEVIFNRYKDLASRSQDDTVTDKEPGQEALDDVIPDNYTSETLFQLPPPPSFSVKQKKQHLTNILHRFMKLAGRDFKSLVSHGTDSTEGELTKVAITSWKTDSWLILLTRLATRGLHNEGEEDDQNFSNLIRESMFSYFADDIRGRLDVVIEWLNEEWYSEYVKAEEERNSDLLQENKSLKVDTPTYTYWAGRVLDIVIPFLEASDRKVCIRLLSDLPHLNEELVTRIRSLCLDPIRFQLGFQSLQFLIMFRPPVKEACVHLLKTMHKETEVEDLKTECLKYLKKYCPEEFS